MKPIFKRNTNHNFHVTTLCIKDINQKGNEVFDQIHKNLIE